MHRGGKTVYTEEVPIYNNHSITQRRKDSVCKRGIYIYQSINYTEDVRQCIQKRYLYIPINQLHRGGKTVHTEEVHINTNQSITQRRQDSAYRRYIYIYQYINYTEEVIQCTQKTYLYIPISKLYRGCRTMYIDYVSIYTNHSLTQRR